MPEQLGRYKITRQLGAGGMGVVYLAEDTVLGRPVALKTLRILEGIDPNARQSFAERFLQEARIVAQMDHPGIVPVYDFGYEGELAYFVLEYVSGTTLSERLEKGPRLDRVTASRILNEAAAALDYAHSRGVIHRDVKPANILLRDDGRVKVADFGIAKLSGAKTMTATGMMMGTVEYMSPEQIRGEAIDGRTDQFSLAVVAYQMITGARPFESNSAISLAHKIAYDQPSPASAATQGLAPIVDRVLAQALDKQPAVRFTTCSEFTRQLEQAWGGVPVTAAVTQIGTREAVGPTFIGHSAMTLPVAAPVPPGHAKKLIWGLAALLAAAVAGIFALVERTPKPVTVTSAPIPTTRPAAVPAPVAKPSPVEVASSGTPPPPPHRTEPTPPPTPKEKRVEEAAPEAEDTSQEPTEDAGEAVPVPVLETRAAAGIPRAMYRLGEAYQKGRDVPRNYATARQWYEKAAAKNFRGAMVAIGDLYFKGLGVPKDYGQARQWYEKAAAAGYREATLRIGDMYLKGAGVPVDYAKARHWYEDGAEKGLRAAMDRIGDLYYRGLGVPQDYAQAKQWYEKAARLGFPIAYVHLGRLYRAGDGVARDCPAARDSYAKAAALNNNSTAMFLLGQLYSEGCPHFPVNKELAREWYTKAADAGNGQAKEMLHRER